MIELFNMMYALAKIIGALGLVLWGGFALADIPLNQWVEVACWIGVAVVAIEVIKVVLGLFALVLISWKPEWFQN